VSVALVGYARTPRRACGHPIVDSRWNRHLHPHARRPTLVTASKPAHAEWARRLLAYEGVDAANDDLAAVARVYDQLHAHFAPLVGPAGAAMLFARSAHLASPDGVALADVSFAAGPQLLLARLRAQEPDVARRAAVALFAMFFTLVTTFIGERLTTELLRRAWPAVDLTTTKDSP